MNVRRSEKIGMLWWSGTVFVNFNLRKKCYLPGEYLQFSAQIINDSKSKIHKAKLLLTQVVDDGLNISFAILFHISICIKYNALCVLTFALGVQILCSRRLSYGNPYNKES
jgi:hypothetical protein